MIQRILLVLFLLNFKLYSQTLEVQGKIVNQNNIPISGAQILSSSNDYHFHSDENGNFKLEAVDVGYIFKIYHIGYEIKEVTIDNTKKPLVIVLKEKALSLNEVLISPKIDALELFADIDIKINPVNSSQEILRQVPGLFIGQHAGGGKAEQIFLRGFDIDHGTDIAIAVDGIPVNMVSHAHGQGYADLHFVIPETIEKVGFGKGPYYADKGNFNTAGYVDFKTKDRLKNSQIKIEAGQFNTRRILGMYNLIDEKDQQAYFAGEFLVSDGAFKSPQNFNRINVFSKYSNRISDKSRMQLIVSHFQSEWDASGQIPQRAVNRGLIGRFGAIDDTEGGKTDRTNISLSFNKDLDDESVLENTFFYSKYNFELFSNFTFFLEDPINGDQIKQSEGRDIFGFNSEYKHRFSTNTIDGDWQLGLSVRNDISKNNELSRTLNRKTTLQKIQSGDINETNIGTYFNLNLDLGKFRINPSVRLDFFDFKYQDALQEVFDTQSENEIIVSPKLNVLYNYSENLQLYIKGGKGFHSNDTRVVINQNGKKIAPDALGSDVGFIWKPTSKLFLNAAYWNLFLEQEFVYVGDAGIVEPSGKTKRQGLEFSLRYQPLKWLFWNFDTNYTHARSVEEANGNDYIPLAPDFTLVSGLNIIHDSGFYGGLNARLIDDRPANEDNSIVAEGYTVFDMNIGYKWKSFDYSLQIQNLFDVEWNETQFATESRLQNEIEPVEEIHFTPGTPFSIIGKIAYNF